MLESVPKGVLEKPLPSLPEADDVAKSSNLRADNFGMPSRMMIFSSFFRG